MKSRIRELDYLKCLFIVLMVIFHLTYIGNKYPFTKLVVYTFHMPAFLLISGYLLNAQKTFTPFMKGMLWIFIPYAVMEIGYTCMSTLLPVYDGVAEVNALVLLSKVFVSPIGPYWYLHTLILCSITYYIIHTYVPASKLTRILIMGSVLFLFSKLHLLSFANALYFIAGIAICESKRPFLSLFPPSGLAILPLILLCSQPENLDRATLAGVVITYLVIILSLYIYKYLPQPVKQSTFFIGQNTLVILLFSPIFTALSKFFLPFFSFDPTGLCFLCIATAFTIYGSIAIAYVMDKLHISPFFLGKKALNNTGS